MLNLEILNEKETNIVLRLIDNMIENAEEIGINDPLQFERDVAIKKGSNCITLAIERASKGQNIGEDPTYEECMEHCSECIQAAIYRAQQDYRDLQVLKQKITFALSGK